MYDSSISTLTFKSCGSVRCCTFLERIMFTEAVFNRSKTEVFVQF